MSTRYTLTEVNGIVEQINIEAMMAGLVPTGTRMTYHPGNTENGISGQVTAWREDEEGYHPVRVDFLPDFNYKQSKTDHAKLLKATLRVFFSFRRLREETEREVKQRIKEFGI